MERLTTKGYKYNSLDFMDDGMHYFANKLSRYEDTGLTPEEIIDGKLRTGWIPVTERLPEDVLNPITRDAYVYPVTVDLGGVTDTRYYSFCGGHWYNQGPKEMDDLVIAWKECPKPYKPE